MERTFTIETSEADELALSYAIVSSQLDYSFNSALRAVINSARDRTLEAERARAGETNEFVPSNPDEAILNSKLKNADTRDAEHLAQMALEAAERERQEQERLAQLAEEETARKTAEDERIRLAAEAAVQAYIDSQNQGDLFKETPS